MTYTFNYVRKDVYPKVVPVNFKHLYLFDYASAISRENLSFEDIGRQLNRSEATARRIWIEAVRQLQREIQIDDSRVC